MVPPAAAAAVQPSLSVRLFGTDEPVPPPRTLRAGPLTVEWEAGNLRAVRFQGLEMIRGVAYLVRDPNWATYQPVLSGEVFEEGPDFFRVVYDAVAGDERQRFRYRAQIEGRADGSVRFTAEGEAETDFRTNRTGFIVLHPIEGVAGQPCLVERTDGRREAAGFPERIDPAQPLSDLRALTHEFAPGRQVTCRMEGDTYEMEDQRNWTDASFKTYVRPLARPWPYLIARGERVAGSVTLTVAGGDPAAAGPTAGEEAVTIGLGAPGEPLPPFGCGLDPAGAADALARADRLREAGPRHVVCAYDPSRGHGPADLARMAGVARALGAEAWLEFVVSEVAAYAEEIAAVGREVAALGAPFTTVLISPAPDLKSTPPGSPWPPCPPLEECYRCARQAFPGVRLGGGMFSYFTELNRKRPPAAHLDLLTFTTSPLVHAGDDRSVMETLEALPHVAASVRAFAGGKPYHVGPSALGMRANPYGAAPVANPRNVRQAMNRVDPRQRGLFGAAWYLGYAARFVQGGAAAVSLGDAVGPFGLVHAPHDDHRQPWFDEHGGGLYPVFHVFRGLARLSGQRRREARVSRPAQVQALAAARDDGAQELWAANLTGLPREVRLEEAWRGTAAALDAEAFGEAARDPRALDAAARPFAGRELTLAPYAVARLVAPSR